MAAGGKSVDNRTMTKAANDTSGSRKWSRQHNNQLSTEGCSGDRRAAKEIDRTATGEVWQ